jgi:hypothetical protein
MARGIARTLTLPDVRRECCRDPLRDAYFLVSAAWCLAIGLGIVEGAADAWGWYVYRLPDPYAFRDYSAGYGFYFTPPVAFAIYPLLLLPWTWFAAVWTGIMFAALYGLTGRWSALALLFPPVWWEIHSANVNLVIALAALWAATKPALWSIPLLTKVTTGNGIVWHLVRREWRPFAIAVLVTGGIAATTFVVAPQLWFDWWASLIANAGNTGPGYFTVDVPLAARLALAIAIVTWGAWTGRRWTLVVAAVLGTPVLWYNALAPLVAVPLLWRARLEGLAARTGAATAGARG